MVTSSPTMQGESGSTWRTAPSWMLLRAPMRTGATSPRMTALNQTLEPGPISTSPTTTAPGAMKTSGAIRGEIPLTASTNGGVASDIGLTTNLDHDRVALPAARTDRGQSETAAASLQFQHQGEDDPGAAGADRMTERDGTAVDVDL